MDSSHALLYTTLFVFFYNKKIREGKKKLKDSPSKQNRANCDAANLD